MIDHDPLDPPYNKKYLPLYDERDAWRDPMRREYWWVFGGVFFAFILMGIGLGTLGYWFLRGLGVIE